MIPNDQPLREQTISRMLGHVIGCLERSNNVYTKWEEDFIVSLDEQFEKKRDLSNKQCEILERIYDK